MPGISLIMLSWERVPNILNNINSYLSYRLIDEIIIFNNNCKYDLRRIANDKITIIESSRDLGLFSRFAAAGLARNSCIMHCDDDLLVPEATVESLYTFWSKSPGICHGLQGRVITDHYNTVNAIGNVDIVLTRCMLVSRSNCLSAFLFSLQFQDVPGEPAGNGEDIILSYTAMYNSKQHNKTYDLPFFNYPNYRENEDGSSVAIHRRWKYHNAHRTKVINRCRERLFQNHCHNHPVTF